MAWSTQFCGRITRFKPSSSPAAVAGSSCITSEAGQQTRSVSSYREIEELAGDDAFFYPQAGDAVKHGVGASTAFGAKEETLDIQEDPVVRLVDTAL